MEENKNIETAIFAGGCFWCMVGPFKNLDGVKNIVSGYTGGNIKNPTYEEVRSQTTGHMEAVKIDYDPSVISYDDLLKIYWMQIDPTDDGGQFQDRGQSYRSAIFYTNDSQKAIAERSKEILKRSGKFSKPIVTRILQAKNFYNAEGYHQDFYINHKEEYEEDRAKSGRDEFIKEKWGQNNIK